MQIPNEISAAIIGFGPRGLSLFERFLSFAALEQYREFQFTLYIFDPGLPGAGVHTTDQRDFILLNTPAYLPTLFPGNIFENPSLNRNGLSFQDWIKTVSKPSYQQEVHSLQPETYLPRRLLGDYLHWVYQQLIEQLPSNVKIHVITEVAKSIIKYEKSFLIKTERRELVVESLFLTIGHAERLSNEADPCVLKNPYPVEKMNRSSFKKIAIAGMGLVAFDLISSCTVGRGGRFSRNSWNQLEYHKSGVEPVIYLFSKTGIPYSARPLQEEQFQYEPISLTREAVCKLRKEKNKLDFTQDIVPLLVNEISISYYLACTRNQKGAEAAATQYKMAECSLQNNTFSLWLKEMEILFGKFDPQELINPKPPSFSSSEDYRNWFVSYLKKDIEEAHKGVASPLKWAAEAMLFVREGIREAVEFDGLISTSMVDFFSKFSPLINKNSIGPELQRSEELLALIEAGIIDLSLGPNPILSSKENFPRLSSAQWPSTQLEVDLFCEAYLKLLPLEEWASPLVQSMVQAGVILPNSTKNPGLIGAQVDRSFRAISKTEEELKIWIVGIMCEGTTYYNNYVPIVWRGAPSTPFLEVHKAVNSFFSTLSAELALH